MVKVGTLVLFLTLEKLQIYLEDLINKCINPYAETKREQFNAQDLEKQRYRTGEQRKGKEVGGGRGRGDEEK